MKVIIQGLGRMGMQIARKLSEHGHQVVALDRTPTTVTMAQQYGCIGALSMQDALENFSESEQVIIWMMLPSEISSPIINGWMAVLPAGSIIINGANNDYRQTKVDNARVKKSGSTLVDVGVSGGIWGYQNGFPLMVGCDDAATVQSLEPLFSTLTQPGGAWGYFGPSGAGNYVKMVHNAIEYGMMQSLAEGYRLLHDGPYDNIDLAKAGDIWQHHSVVTSWLNDLTRTAVAENPNMDGISGYVAESGETRWALETAESLGYKLPAIQAAFDVRINSQHGDINYATKVVAAQRNKFGGHNLNGEGKA